MSDSHPAPDAATPFALRDCALITLSTGFRAQNLQEFREGLTQVPVDSIAHHFWGRLLQPLFDEPEYSNDFASWAYRGLHDKPLAERLSMILPTDFDCEEDLRQELLEVVEERLDESELIPWARADQWFYFLRSQLISFDSGMELEDPGDLAACLPNLSTGSIFYHFIDARNRTAERCDDFSAWLMSCGAPFEELARRLGDFDPYFSSLREIRRTIARIAQDFFEELA